MLQAAQLTYLAQLSDSWSAVEESIYQGIFGLAPRDVLSSDVFAIFFGCRTPFVLRNISYSVEATGFEFIGDCEVFGMMHGEMQEDESYPSMEF